MSAPAMILCSSSDVNPTNLRANPGFRVQGSGFRFWGSGFRVQGSGFRFWGSGFRVQGSGFRVQGLGFQLLREPHEPAGKSRIQDSVGVQDSGFRVQGSGFKVQG